ncbi:hypothetical protein LFX15_18255 [Leptospira levettii]|uniref:hypothetical protein n=1 Tax=Leptospira levettii TaxID=2023178 RepID=UPI001EEA4A62|nr:hypothetical protein [Leptospira levettii]MCG6150246.1 hypothetical protein [Leptospira levettii]
MRETVSGLIPSKFAKCSFDAKHFPFDVKLSISERITFSDRERSFLLSIRAGIQIPCLMLSLRFA